jgi:hypothetical protein
MVWIWALDLLHCMIESLYFKAASQLRLKARISEPSFFLLQTKISKEKVMIHGIADEDGATRSHTGFDVPELVCKDSNLPNIKRFYILL